MKYIVTKTKEGKEEIFIFPKSINHDCMMEALRGIRNQSTGQWVRVRRQAIAAGFVRDIGDGDGIVCYGRSESLQLESRGLQDSLLVTE